MCKKIWFFWCLFLLNASNSVFLTAQYPIYQQPDTATMGENISRTMDLLHNSDPDNKTVVKILVYGQSINKQDWWLDLKSYLQDLYPNAYIDMRNRSIGGFQSPFLKKTTYFDVLPFYPDLVLFHDYGNHYDKELIIENIRKNTTAEILWRSSHFRGTEDEDNHRIFLEDHENRIPASCEKYGLEFGSFYGEWQTYLDEYNLEYNKLTTDNVHLNDHGKYLMTEMHKPYFYYHEKWEPDPDSLVNYYQVGNEITWNGDTLNLTFLGNRADLIFNNLLLENITDTVKIFVDGKPPKMHKDIYTHTRPSHYKGDSLCFANCIGTMIRLDNDNPLIAETWSFTYDSVNENHTDFYFSLEGSRTGPDGSGSKNNTFISNSGRVKISHGDWFVKEAHDYFHVNLHEGYKLTWESLALGHDMVIPMQRDDGIENHVTLFQGLPNTKHDLKIVFKGAKECIQGIRTYWPPLERKYEYNKTYTLTTLSEKKGWVSPTGTNIFNKGETVSITAIPDSGYQFLKWEGTGITSESIDVVMNQDTSFKALFDTLRYVLGIYSQKGGTTHPSGKNDYPLGTTVKVVAIPDNGFEFIHWIGDTAGINSINDTVWVTMNTAKVLLAFWKDTREIYILKTAASEGGVVIPAGENEYYEGEQIILIAIPDPGYSFTGWDGFNDPNDTITFTINSNMNLTANFSLVNSIKTRGINDNLFSVYPNPVTSGILFIEHLYNNKEASYQVILEDISGKIIFGTTIQLEANSYFPLDITKISRGIYNLKIYNKASNFSTLVVKF